MVREKAASYYVTYGNVHVHHAVVFICLGWLMVSVTEILKILEITDKPKDLLHLPLFIFCYLCAYFGNRHLRPCCYIPAIVLNLFSVLIFFGQALVHFVVVALEFLEQLQSKTLKQVLSENRTEEIRYCLQGLQYICWLSTCYYSLRVIYRDYRYLKDVVMNPNSTIPNQIDL